LVGKEFGRGPQKKNKEITKSDPISTTIKKRAAFRVARAALLVPAIASFSSSRVIHFPVERPGLSTLARSGARKGRTSPFLVPVEK